MGFETSSIFFISLLLLWLKPGPGQALKLTCALEKGVLPAFFVASGITTICILYFLIVALGYNALVGFFESLGAVLKIFGGVYLCYLGVKGLLHKPQIDFSSDGKRFNKSHLLGYYGLGLLMSLSNPITIFYFISILPTLIPVGVFSSQDIISGVLLILSVGVVVDALLIVLMVQAKQVFLDTSFSKYFSAIASISFILIGGYFIYAAFFIDHFSFELV